MVLKFAKIFCAALLLRSLESWGGASRWDKYVILIL